MTSIWFPPPAAPRAHRSRSTTGDADPVDYRISDANGTPTTSTYTPTVTPAVPAASADTSSGRQGVPQLIDLLANDAAGDPGVPLDPATLTLLDADGEPVDQVTVPGQGTYTVEDGKILFTPLPEFAGTADPASYRILDINGSPTDSTVTPSVTAVTAPDMSSEPAPAQQSVDPLANDPASPGITLDPATLTLIDADGNRTATVTYDGQGSYVLQGTTITFTPESGFVGQADPVIYRVTDSEGYLVGATYTATAATPELAYTGVSDVGLVSTLGGGLLLAGAALMLVGRRRPV